MTTARQLTPATPDSQQFSFGRAQLNKQLLLQAAKPPSSYIAAQQLTLATPGTQRFGFGRAQTSKQVLVLLQAAKPPNSLKPGFTKSLSHPAAGTKTASPHNLSSWSTCASQVLSNFCLSVRYIILS